MSSDPSSIKTSFVSFDKEWTICNPFIIIEYTRYICQICDHDYPTKKTRCPSIWRRVVSPWEILKPSYVWDTVLNLVSRIEMNEHSSVEMAFWIVNMDGKRPFRMGPEFHMWKAVFAVSPPFCVRMCCFKEWRRQERRRLRSFKYTDFALQFQTALSVYRTTE